MLRVIEIPGGRLRFQIQSMRELWRHVGGCDLILSQEVLRGVAERQRDRPAPAHACRHLHGHLSARVLSLPARASSDRAGRRRGWAARSSVRWRPSTADSPLAASRWDRTFARSRPVVRAERDRSVLRRGRRAFPSRGRGRACAPASGAWTCLPTSSSSCSRAGSATRRIRKRSCAPSRSPVGRGLDAVLLNLGGGHREFLALPARLGIDDASSWLLARPAVHPMKDLADYFRAADAVALASLAEGAAIRRSRRWPAGRLWSPRRSAGWRCSFAATHR